MSEQRMKNAVELVASESLFLDECEWNRWLDLFTVDAIIWAPSWRDEATLTTDPERELSLLYLAGRSLLAERVQRATSGRSSAALPMPRTSHQLTTSVITDADLEVMTVRTSFCSYVYQHKDAALVTYAGRYEHHLIGSGTEMRILRKKIIVINDQLESMVDFFYL